MLSGFSDTTVEILDISVLEVDLIVLMRVARSSIGAREFIDELEVEIEDKVDKFMSFAALSVVSGTSVLSFAAGKVVVSGLVSPGICSETSVEPIACRKLGKEILS